MINWNKPTKIRSTEEHNEKNSSDCGVPGTYVPNMSEEDQLSWKGKLVTKTDNPRVELRKTFSRDRNYAQVLIIIDNNENITISTNGKISMSFDEYEEFLDVMSEANDKLIEETEGKK